MSSIQEIYEIFINCNYTVCTDTRKIESGCLFFALKGDNFDANEFAAQAHSKKAPAMQLSTTKNLQHFPELF
jgi:UDP-N-acetylmuramoyl-tripeptide--D-alanyl-D-alanine ligase